MLDIVFRAFRTLLSPLAFLLFGIGMILIGPLVVISLPFVALCHIFFASGSISQVIVYYDDLIMVRLSKFIDWTLAR